jgi:hypothetical protein
MFILHGYIMMISTARNYPLRAYIEGNRLERMNNSENHPFPVCKRRPAPTSRAFLFAKTEIRSAVKPGQGEGKKRGSIRVHASAAALADGDARLTAIPSHPSGFVRAF